MIEIENVVKPLVKCPACAGAGILQWTDLDESTNTWVVVDEEYCSVCETAGEVTFSRFDDYMDWTNA